MDTSSAGDRLVKHHHPRIERQRPRDGDALPLAATELVRVHLRLIRPQPDLREQVQHLALPSPAAVSDVFTTSGSATMVFTRMRGFIDPHGS